MFTSKKSKKSSSKSNVVVGGAKKHKKRIWIASLAVLLLLSVGAGSYVVWKGNSLKAKAENWTVVGGGPWDGYLLRACRAYGYGGYALRFFALKTTNNPVTVTVYSGGDGGLNAGYSGIYIPKNQPWRQGWGFTYADATSFVKSYWAGGNDTVYVSINQGRSVNTFNGKPGNC